MLRSCVPPLALATLVLASACDDEARAPVPRGRLGPTAAAERGSPFLAPGRQGAPPPLHRARLRPGAGPGAAPTPAPGTGPAPARDEAPSTEPAKAPEVRDFPRELRSILGDPASCLGAGEDLPGEVAIRVSATVTGTGVVTRSEAAASGLSDAALACVRGRLANARLRAPVPGAPRTIQTTLAFRRTPPPEKRPAAPHP